MPWTKQQTLQILKPPKQIDFASRFPPRHFEASRLCGLHVLDRNRHQKRFFTKTITSGMNFKIFIVLWRPKGPNQTLRIRILDRYVFSVIPTSCQKRFSTKTKPSGMKFKMLVVLGRPEGPDQMLRNRIFDRYVFSVISTSGSHLVYIWKTFRLHPEVI